VSGRAKVVFLKEVLDNLRDRRSSGTALLYALMGPLMLIPMLGFVTHTWDRGSGSVVKVAIAGAEQAPGLVEYMRARNIELEPAPSDPAEAVRDLQRDLVVVIPPTYAEDFHAGRPAAVRIVTDHSRTTAAGIIRRVSDALESYSNTVGTLRLMARGVSPSVVSALAIEVDDVATPESEGAMVLGIVPMFLLTSLFFGGLYIAVDVTAGERERGSLEPLVSTPLTAAEIVLGKLGAVFFFQLVTMVATLVAFTLVVNVAPFPEVPGMKFKLDVLSALEIFLVLAPLILPVAALQMLVSSRGRTVKEAFTAASLVTLIPMASGIFLILAPYRTTTASMAIPVFGQNLLMNEVLRGAPVAALSYAVAAGSAMVAGVALSMLAVARCAHSRMLADR
jgi:sodium transport system permease protein